MARRHRVWHVQFRGVKGTYPDAVGMERLAKLLAAHGQEIGSLELVVGLGPAAASLPSVRPTPEDGLAVSRPGSLGDIIDGDSKKDLERRAKEIAGEIAEAREIGDGERVEGLLAELEWIKVELRRSRGLRGRRRKESDEHEATRKTVQKTVRGAIDAFEDDLPELHAHLDRSVQLGLTCRYNPDPPERWRVSS